MRLLSQTTLWLLLTHKLLQLTRPSKKPRKQLMCRQSSRPSNHLYEGECMGVRMGSSLLAPMCI